jgi:hypothetical protein
VKELGKQKDINTTLQEVIRTRTAFLVHESFSTKTAAKEMGMTM